MRVCVCLLCVCVCVCMCAFVDISAKQLSEQFSHDMLTLFTYQQANQPVSLADLIKVLNKVGSVVCHSMS